MAGTSRMRVVFNFYPVFLRSGNGFQPRIDGARSNCQVMEIPGSGRYEQIVPVLMDARRWAPRPGEYCSIRAIAARIELVTRTRARSEAEEIRRSRPPSPTARRNSPSRYSSSRDSSSTRPRSLNSRASSSSLCSSRRRERCSCFAAAA
jgi:hypothetical protein